MIQEDSIRILLADDHPVVRTGLALMIKYEPGMEVVAQASNGKEAVDLFRTHQPDITLMDLRMPELNGVEAIAAIKSEFPDARIVVVTSYDSDEDIYLALRAGAKGYLLKDATREQLLNAIRVVYTGRASISPAVGAKLAERLGNPELSDRETEVVRLMATGKTNQEIAAVLGITEGTVKFHVNNILSKLEVSDRTQAVIKALKRGIANL